MNVFKCDGVEIRYRVHGQGENVFLCWHGFGGGPADFQDVAPMLGRHAKVIIPNLKYFIGSQWPKTFSRQIEILALFTQQIWDVHRPKKLHMLGQSYGGTLSLALRAFTHLNVSRHWLLNPMPFDPLASVQNKKIQDLLFALKAGRDMVEYMRSAEGHENLVEAARVFRIGATGQHEIHHFNERKLLLVEKAMERFLWIEQRENWAQWFERLASLTDQSIDRVYYSSHDSLFDTENYEKFIAKIRPKDQIKIDHNGHLLLQDKWAEVFAEFAG